MLCIILASIPDSQKGSFTELYNHYNKLMISVAYKILNNYHDAEDAVIDAFWSIHKRYDAVQNMSETEQRLYCCQAAKNKAITIYNKNRIRYKHEVSFDKIINAYTDEDTDDDVITDYTEKDFYKNSMTYTDEDLELICEESESDLLLKMIEKLPEIYKDVMFMYYTQDRSIDDIADELDISIDAVRKRISRGRTALIESVKK